GMAVTFAAIATLAAVGGGWAVQANQYGRWAAIVLLAVFGITLLFPGLSDRMTRPLVALGARLSQSAENDAAASGATILPSLLLGVATGLLWAPCAGPVLGLILTGAALQGTNIQTSLLLAIYAAGAATSLALALLVGGRVFAAMKRSIGIGEWVRRGLGVAVLIAVAAIAFGLDTGALTRISLAGTNALEQHLLNKFHSTANGNPDTATTEANTSLRLEALPVEGRIPTLSGATEWLNSPPLTTDQLKGKVVLIDFWTYSCINCLRTLPYVRAWAEKYKDQGLVVIGVHTPEFAFEKNIDNVKRAVADLRVGYPVALDNDFTIWRAFNNQYWPAHYFIDAKGQIRHHHFGEGNYDESERVIQQLLAEAGKPVASASLVSVKAAGAEMAPGTASDVKSPETYIGYERAENFISPGGPVRDSHNVYTVGTPRLNEWGLTGDWTIEDERAGLNAAGGSIVYKFHARDLHLVLGPASDGKPIRFRVTIDGKPPGDNHGTDIDADGRGVITEQRLYQLVRQSTVVSDKTFEIQFLDPGVQAYAFTFG
ncbi:MAG TPA: cytochrome c biogenesis protein DipZ, partial [Afipia sp.]